MKRKIPQITAGLFISALLFAFHTSGFAQESNEELLKKIETLQKRVDELEAIQKDSPDSDPWGFYKHRRNNHWDPFAEMHRMQEEMSRMFQNSFDHRGWSQGGIFSNDLNFKYDFDIKETKDGYEIRVDMAGLDNEKVDFEINEHSITVKGEHSREDTREGPDKFFQSQSFGSFMKTISLPTDADTSKVKTEKEGDTLVIQLPKKPT